MDLWQDKNKTMVSKQNDKFTIRNLWPNKSNNNALIKYYQDTFDLLKDEAEILQIDAICGVILQYLLFSDLSGDDPNFEDVLKWVSMDDNNICTIKDTKSGEEYRLYGINLRKGDDYDLIKSRNIELQCPYDIHDIPIEKWSPNWFQFRYIGYMMSISFQTTDAMFKFLTHCKIC